MDGLTIAFSDEHEETTAGGGYYSRTVPAGWTGTFLPIAAAYSFTPAFATIIAIHADTTQDFIVLASTYEISGTVETGSGDPVAGVVLALSAGDLETTGPDGTYSFTVNHGWSGTVTPSKVGWTINPPQRIYSNVTSDQTNQDYTGTASADTYTISGTVTDQGIGAGMDGVTLTFSDGHEETTSGGGNYSYTVPVFWSGTVIPDELPGYIFSPAPATIGPVQADTIQDFSATPATHAISGMVMDHEATAVEGLP